MKIFKGVNTDESGLIEQTESKFALNCYNHNNKLGYQRYNKDFDIPKTEIFEREYDSIEFDTDTSINNSRFDLEYEEDGKSYKSGIIKPSVNFFADTTNDKTNNGYLAVIKSIASKIKFKSPYNGLGIVDPIIVPSFIDLLDKTAHLCEVYQDIEIACSYSNAYGESGLTKYFFTNDNLHNLVVIEDIPKDHDKYNYLNIYVKYGSMENMRLLKKIDLNTLSNYRLRRIGTDVDYNYAYEQRGPNWISVFNSSDKVTIDGNTPANGSIPEQWQSDSNLISDNGGETMVVYLGLYQFEEPDKLNYSWFVSNNITEVLPLITTETQTYLSGDDYEILNAKNNAILNSISDDNNFFNDALDDVKYLSNVTYFRDYSLNDFTDDDLYGNQITYKANNPVKTEDLHSKIDSDVVDYCSSFLDHMWGTKAHKAKYARKKYEYDMLRNGIENIYNEWDTRIEMGRWKKTGVIYIQYFKESDEGDFVFLDTSRYEMSASEMYTTFYFPQIAKTESNNFKIKIWWTASLTDESDTLDKNYYCIFEDTSLNMATYWDASSTDRIDNGIWTPWKKFFDGMNDVMLGIYCGDQFYKTDKTLPYRGYGVYEDGSIRIALDIGALSSNKQLKSSFLKVLDDDNILITDTTTIEETAEENLENITADIGSNNFEWRYIIDGISINNTDKLNTRVNFSHSEKYDGRLWHITKDLDKEDYKDLYYSEQGYPEILLETNYKGYDEPITGIKEFIEQLYVFQENRVDIIKKSLSRQSEGILEPTYQYHKSFDKGAIEWTIQEFKKRMYFTNQLGVYAINASGSYDLVSQDIDRLFSDGFINSDTVDYASIKDDFYIIKLKKNNFINLSDIIDYNTRGTIVNNTNYELTVPTKYMYVEEIAYNCKTKTWWFGNNEERIIYNWFYFTKDFNARNQYENFSKGKQNKRLSINYKGYFKLTQIHDKQYEVGKSKYSGNTALINTARRTLMGGRNFYYGFLLWGTSSTQIYDWNLIENGR